LDTKYSLGALISGQFTFAILKDGKISGQGTGQIIESESYSGTQTTEKGDCLKRSTGQIRFTVSGKKVPTGSSSSITPRVHLIFSPVRSSYTVDCLTQDGKISTKKDLKKLDLSHF
jgi:hypothetical protein